MEVAAVTPRMTQFKQNAEFVSQAIPTWWRSRATLIVGKKGRREIGKSFPTNFSSLRLVSTLNLEK